MQRQGSIPDEVVEVKVEDEREREGVCMFAKRLESTWTQQQYEYTTLTDPTRNPGQAK